MKNKLICFVFVGLFLISFVSATLNVALSHQASDLRYSNGSLVPVANLTIFVYDSMAGMNLIYNETFVGAIKDGSWNVMIGENPLRPLNLEYGKIYYQDIEVDGSDFNFTNSSGDEVPRKLFHSPLGDVGGEDLNLTNLTLNSLNVTGITNLGNVTIDADNITVNNILPKDGGEIKIWGNLISSNGFFNWLGSLASRVTEFFVQDINFNGTLSSGKINITGSTGNIETSGSMNASNYTLNGTTINDWNEAGIDTQKGTSGNYVYNDSINIMFNETQLNITIDARSDFDTQKGTSGKYVYNDSINVMFNETQLNETIESLDSDTTYSHLSNFTDDLGNRGYTHLTNFTDDILWTPSFNNTFDSRDKNTWNTSAEMWLAIDNGTFLKSFTEADPFWQANLTAHNASWSLDTDTWNTSTEMWLAIDNGTFLKSFTEADPFFSANLTAHNASWSYYEVDTDTWNTSAEMWGAIDNGTFSKATHLSNLTDDILWTVDFNATGDSRWGGGIDTQKNATGYLYNDSTTIYLNETKLNETIESLDNDTTYSHLSNFTDNLGNRGYTHLTNFTDNILWTVTFNSTFDSRDKNTWNTSAEMWLAIDNGTFLKLFTEVDPFWQANLTAHNASWSLDTDTWNTSAEMWLAIDNGTFLKSFTEADPFFSANLTAHNASWNYYEVNTDTWNTSAEMWLAIDNGTFSKATHLSNLTDDILWTAVFNATGDSRWSKIEIWNESGANIYLGNLSKNVGIGTSTPSVKLDVNGTIKINSFIELGTNDSYNRGQMWNYLPSSVLRLGSLQADGDSLNVVSEGIVVYGKEIGGGDMSTSNFSYARIKNNRFGLYSAITGGLSNYYFRVDPTSMYLRNNNDIKTFEVNRETGNIDTSGNINASNYTLNYTTINDWSEAGADTHVAGDNNYLINDSTTMYFNETKLNATIDARDSDTTYSHLSNFTDDLEDRGYTSLSNFTDDLGNRGYTHLTNFTDDILWTTAFNNTFDSRDKNTWNTSSEIWNSIDNDTFLKSFTEADPFFSANLTAHNASWNEKLNQVEVFTFADNGTFLKSFTELDPFWQANLTAHNASWNYYEINTDTWNTSAEMWLAIDNGTFLKTFNEADPFFSANLTAHNASWNYYEVNTDTWNTSAEMWLAIDNGTFSKATHLSNLTDDILWTANFNSTGDSRWSGGTEIWNKSGWNIYPGNLSKNVGIGTATPSAKLEILPLENANAFAVRNVTGSVDAFSINENGSFMAMANDGGKLLWLPAGSGTLKKSGGDEFWRLSEESMFMGIVDTAYIHINKGVGGTTPSFYVRNPESGQFNKDKLVEFRSQNNNIRHRFSVGNSTDDVDYAKYILGDPSGYRIEMDARRGEVGVLGGDNWWSLGEETFFRSYLGHMGDTKVVAWWRADLDQFGVNHTLLLTPTDSPNTCDAAAKGSLYYDDSSGELYDCDGASWQAVSSEGVEIWNESGANIYPRNLSQNVGIGTNNPGAQLEIKEGAGPYFRFNANSDYNSIESQEGLDIMTGDNRGLRLFSSSNSGFFIHRIAAANQDLPHSIFSVTGGPLGQSTNLLDLSYVLDSDTNAHFIRARDNATDSSGVPTGGIDRFTVNYKGDVYASGDVGIGTSTPSVKLDVLGFIKSDNFYTNATSHRTYVGENVGTGLDGDYVTAIGEYASHQNTQNYVTSLGYQAGRSNTGSSQTAIGSGAGYQNSGSSQTALGYNAGRVNSGSSQTAIGSSAGSQNTGVSQTALGYYAGYLNTGNRVIGIGYESTRNNTADNVVAMGYQAGKDNAISNQFIVKQANVNTIPLIQGDFSSGNVGIGTSTPEATLEVKGAGTVLIINDTNASANNREWFQIINKDGDKKFEIGSIGNGNPELRFGDACNTKLGFPPSDPTYFAFINDYTEMWLGNAADDTLYFNYYNGSAEYHGTNTNRQKIEYFVGAGANGFVIDGDLRASNYYSGDGSQGITDTTGYWLCNNSACSTTCQVQIKDGLIVGCT